MSGEQTGSSYISTVVSYIFRDLVRPGIILSISCVWRTDWQLLHHYNYILLFQRLGQTWDNPEYIMCLENRLAALTSVQLYPIFSETWSDLG